MDYVPLRAEHDAVWSRKFGKLLDEIGSAVDSFFKVVILEGRLFPEYHDKDPKNLDIVAYREIVGPVYRLSDAVVTVSDGVATYGELSPFAEFGDKKSPDWWAAYQKYKHFRYSNIEYANLRNVVQALAGLFVLNALHKENQEFLVENSMIRTVFGSSTKGVLGSLRDSKFGIVAGYLCEARSRLFLHKLRPDVRGLSEIA